MDISRFLPKPFTITADDFTVTSPSPTVETGKILAAYQETQAAAFERAKEGKQADDLEIPGWPDTMEELANLVLASGEYDRLVAEGAPLAFINQATMCAVIYWANGASEAAVTLYMKAVTGELTKEDDPAPKGRKRSKSGPHTA